MINPLAGELGFWVMVVVACVLGFIVLWQNDRIEYLEDKLAQSEAQNFREQVHL